METTKPTIECAENGPYLVKGLEDLRTSEEHPIPTKKVMALCRCGASENKPFCDGTHSTIGFNGEKQEGRTPDRRDSYEGKEVTLHDNRSLCSHRGHCTDHAATVWKLKSEPWIDPDGAGTEEIIKTVRMCPSGALSYSIDGVEHRDIEYDPAVTVSKDGPYEVTGGIDLLDVEWGEGASQEHYALCRCGASKNKPFCDGTHWSIEFKDEQTDAIGDRPSE